MELSDSVKGVFGDNIKKSMKKKQILKVINSHLVSYFSLYFE
jgi:hypothetical protein